MLSNNHKEKLKDVDIAQIMRKMAYNVVTRDLGKEPSLNQIGEEIVRSGIENRTDGGIFLYSVTKGEEWYSPKFRETLGFTNEEDFPNLPDSWQKHIHPDDLKVALSLFGEHIASRGKVPYILPCRYTTKQGKEIELICDGDVVTWDPDVIMLGIHSHKVI